MRILSRFLGLRFLSSVLIVLALVAGIIFIITFVEKLPGAASITASLHAALTGTLDLIPLFLPLVVFMGTLLASYNLTRSSEMVIVQSAGLSPYQSMRPYLFVAAIIGIITATVVNPYSVRLSNTDINSNKLMLVDGDVWLREYSDAGAITLRAADMAISGDKLVFKNAIVFQQGNDSRLIMRIEAKNISLSGNRFATQNATLYKPDGTMKSGTSWSVPTLLNNETVLQRYLRPEQMSFWKLPRFILDMHQIGITARGHLIQFWTLLFLPLSLIAMAVLGVAFAQTHERRNYSFGIKFSIGIVACFVLYFVMNVFSALGLSGSLPTLLAVIAPPIIIIAGAALFIVSYDTI
ncbi:MAG: LptF/LptG family permease [Proteobacteria bacterium]|nr:LptF/LptG family permease [Pseudomonadota bacterium]